MLQAVVLCSKKQFQITQQGDAVAFLSWLLNALHLSLGGTKKADSSVIYKVLYCCNVKLIHDGNAVQIPAFGKDTFIMYPRYRYMKGCIFCFFKCGYH